MSIDALNDYSIGDSNLNGIMTSLDASYVGKANIAISNYANNSAPVVKVGSIFENSGELFQISSSDVTPTGFSGIANSTTFYLYFDESGTTFIFSSTVPTWSDAKQGWYNGNDRAFYSMYKDSGGTLYQLKVKLLPPARYEFQNDVNIRQDLTVGGDATIADNLTVETNATIVGTLDAPTLNTGQGDNKLYDMDQHVKTTSSPTFGALTLTGALEPSETVDSTWALTTAKYTVPRGAYVFFNTVGPTVYSIVECNFSGTWRLISSGNNNSGPVSQRGGMFFSNGSNIRVSMVSGTGTMWYIKY